MLCLLSNTQSLSNFLCLYAEKELVIMCKAMPQTKWKEPADWKEIFTNDVTDKELISKTYKQLIQLNIKTPNNPVKI